MKFTQIDFLFVLICCTYVLYVLIIVLEPEPQPVHVSLHVWTEYLSYDMPWNVVAALTLWIAIIAVVVAIYVGRIFWIK